VQLPHVTLSAEVQRFWMMVGVTPAAAAAGQGIAEVKYASPCVDADERHV